MDSSVEARSMALSQFAIAIETSVMALLCAAVTKTPVVNPYMEAPY